MILNVFIETSNHVLPVQIYDNYRIWNNALALTVIIHCRNMMTSSNGNIFRVTGPLCGEFTGPGEFPTQRPVTWSFDLFFDLSLNKQLSKQPWGWWFETPSWSLWRQYNECRFTASDCAAMNLNYDECNYAHTCCSIILGALTTGRCDNNFKIIIFKLITQNRSLDTAVEWMPHDLFNDNSNTDSGNGSVPSGNKPLPEPMLAKIADVILRHWATMS